MTAPQLNYRPDIDGLRGLSILLVLGFHGFPQLFPGGYIGVDVFFVISGYLITTQIYSQVRLRNFSIKSFYSRRIRRIFPPLITVLIISGLYSYFCLSLDEFNSLFNHVVAGTTFTTNFLLWQESGYFDKQAELKPLLHLWSLAIEEQFYVIWPILVLLFVAVESRIRHALVWGLKRRPDSFEPSASEQQAFEADINRIIDGVVSRTTGVVAFDPARRLCNINNCPGFVDGIPVYSDEAHITAQASLLFLSDIQSLVGIKQ